MQHTEGASRDCNCIGIRKHYDVISRVPASAPITPGENVAKRNVEGAKSSGKWSERETRWPNKIVMSLVEIQAKVYGPSLQRRPIKNVISSRKPAILLHDKNHSPRLLYTRWGHNLESAFAGISFSPRSSMRTCSKLLPSVSGTYKYIKSHKTAVITVKHHKGTNIP